DRTAPAAPTITTYGPDTGASSADHVTSATSITLTGTADLKSTVTVFDGTAAVGTGTVDASGKWTLATTGSLSEGTHTLTVKATDAAGNTGSASALTLTVDLTAPTVPSISAFVPDTGVAGDGITNANTVTL